MDTSEEKKIKNELDTLKKELTDISRSLKEALEMLKTYKNGYWNFGLPPERKYVFVKVENLSGDRIYRIPQIAAIIDGEWFNPYQPEPYESDQNPFRIIGWKEIPKGIIQDE